jgi:hypothetical protein
LTCNNLCVATGHKFSPTKRSRDGETLTSEARHVRDMRCRKWPPAIHIRVTTPARDADCDTGATAKTCRRIVELSSSNNILSNKCGRRRPGTLALPFPPLTPNKGVLTVYWSGCTAFGHPARPPRRRLRRGPAAEAAGATVETDPLQGQAAGDLIGRCPGI